MKTHNDRIFISIAAYRDPELLPTVRDCIAKAKNPDRLYFGICWQRAGYESLEEFEDHPQVKYFDIDWKNSQGACWARHLIQKNLFSNESYYLQLDSHHRFLHNWDEELIRILDAAKQLSQKPIIGSYATTYWPEEPLLKNEPYRINTFDAFGADGDLISRPVYIHNHADLKVDFIPARLLSGHFIFSDGCFVDECMYDPKYYFRGEELVLSVRAFTKGYDFYHPTKTIIWHEYLRKEKNKHWIDHTPTNGIEKHSESRNLASKERQRQLLGMEPSKLNFGRYGLGHTRTIHDYELYCGVDFKNRKVHKYCFNLNGDSPDPYTMSESEWMSGMLMPLSYEVTWPIEKIPSDVEFDFWFFGFETKDGKLLYRSDFNSDDKFYYQFFTKQNNKFKCNFHAEKRPDQCVIIPHIKGGDWAEKLIIPV